MTVGLSISITNYLGLQVVGEALGQQPITLKNILKAKKKLNKIKIKMILECCSILSLSRSATDRLWLIYIKALLLYLQEDVSHVPSVLHRGEA